MGGLQSERAQQLELEAADSLEISAYGLLEGLRSAKFAFKALPVLAVG
jgi:hypothetical protein